MSLESRIERIEQTLNADGKVKVSDFATWALCVKNKIDYVFVGKFKQWAEKNLKNESQQ